MTTGWSRWMQPLTQMIHQVHSQELDLDGEPGQRARCDVRRRTQQLDPGSRPLLLLLLP